MNTETLKIFDNEKNTLSFDLRDILVLIDGGESYQWELKNMDINIIQPNILYKELSNEEMVLIDKIEASISYYITWDDLVRLSNCNIQIISGDIKGIKSHYSIYINVFDGSYWTIKSNQRSFLNRVRSRFKFTKFV
ncbi:MAG: hypothetical protein ACO1HP_11250 [Bacteroidota bacterium]|jgi:hypothetical protein